ncbi:MAG: hypothetical protein PHF87_10875 [Desulfotomaculaceae bacterium]|nr:hypothetical protein [Desulfotomaculaceae bacterium]
MKNKNRIFRVSALLLVLCFISTVMISGTFAKYTSEYSGQDTALVARWQFDVTDGNTAGEDITKQLDLFSHSFNKNINSESGGDFIIAPGVHDEFTVEMTFLSDVDAKVTVNFTDEDGTVGVGLPIEYLVVNEDETNSNWVKAEELSEEFVAMVVERYPDLAAAADSADNTFTFGKTGVDVGTANEINQVVKWRWAFDAGEQDGDNSKGYESDDVTDTGFGNTSAAGGATRTTYILNVSVKAEQLPPLIADDGGEE